MAPFPEPRAATVEDLEGVLPAPLSIEGYMANKRMLANQDCIDLLRRIWRLDYYVREWHTAYKDLDERATANWNQVYADKRAVEERCRLAEERQAVAEDLLGEKTGEYDDLLRRFKRLDKEHCGTLNNLAAAVAKGRDADELRRERDALQKTVTSVRDDLAKSRKCYSAAVEKRHEEVAQYKALVEQKDISHRRLMTDYKTLETDYRGALDEITRLKGKVEYARSHFCFENPSITINSVSPSAEAANGILLQNTKEALDFSRRKVAELEQRLASSQRSAGDHWKKLVAAETEKQGLEGRVSELLAENKRVCNLAAANSAAAGKLAALTQGHATVIDNLEFWKKKGNEYYKRAEKDAARRRACEQELKDAREKIETLEARSGDAIGLMWMTFAKKYAAKLEKANQKIAQLKSEHATPAYVWQERHKAELEQISKDCDERLAKAGAAYAAQQGHISALWYNMNLYRLAYLNVEETIGTVLKARGDTELIMALSADFKQRMRDTEKNWKTFKPENGRRIPDLPKSLSCFVYKSIWDLMTGK